MTPRMLLPLITLIMLQACSHIPSPRDLSFDLPERWFGAPAKLDDKKDEAQTQDPTLSLEEELRGWWLYFNDETLNHLIELALKDSPTRAIAQARILEARGESRTLQATLFPQINASGAIGREDTGLIEDNYYNAAFDATYEFDIFGSNRMRRGGARENIASQSATYEDITLTLIGDVARTYIALRAAQQRVILVRNSIDIQKRQHIIADARVHQGVAPQQDEIQAAIALSQSQALLPEYKHAVNVAITSLSILTGMPASSLAPMLETTHSLPRPELKLKPLIEPPSTVILRRPDVQAAHHNLNAMAKLSDAAVRDLFPSLSIGGVFGLSDTATLSHETVWDIALKATTPILNFGVLKGQIDANRARERQAYEQFRLATLQALADIESAASAYIQAGRAQDAYADALQNAQKHESLEAARYDQGESAYADYLTAQSARLNAALQALTADQTYMNATISIYKSLGVY